MDALTAVGHASSVTTPVSASASVPHVEAHVPSGTGGSSAFSPPATSSREALPALPVAVQRTAMEPPHAKLMTREEMLDLLSLAV
jgi:hypothetical protein